ncbi:hypothetical protein F5B17DRAFT_56140 [Nemania serpens]|nr:hypothetical protein F5B17DRAFT_56140 [Nemania serpens]
MKFGGRGFFFFLFLTVTRSKWRPPQVRVTSIGTPYGITLGAMRRSNGCTETKVFFLCVDLSIFLGLAPRRVSIFYMFLY